MKTTLQEPCQTRKTAENCGFCRSTLTQDKRHLRMIGKSHQLLGLGFLIKIAGCAARARSSGGAHLWLGLDREVDD